MLHSFVARFIQKTRIFFGVDTTTAFINTFEETTFAQLGSIPSE